MSQTNALIRFSKEQIDTILSEIVQFEVDLSEDPTLPNLGIRYLQKVVAQCRNYTNRVAYYLQSMARMERELLRELKILEMDLDFKTQEKLADDPIVRKQPSIDDRKALTYSMLKIENQRVAELRAELLDLQESIKIVKFRHAELQRTAHDIKTQRNLVKDDMQDQLSGGPGYTKPQAEQDGSVAGGLPPPVNVKPLEPADMFDPEKRPDDMPEPVDEAHAKQIVAFLQAHPIKPSKTMIDQSSDNSNSKTESEQPQIVSISYDDLLS